MMDAPGGGRCPVRWSWVDVRRVRWMLIATALLLLAWAITVLSSTNQSQSKPVGGTPLTPATAMAVALGTPSPHLVLVMLENKEFTQVVGNSAASYFNNTLVPSGRLFTAHYGSA